MAVTVSKLSVPEVPTIMELKKAIPAPLFQSNLLLSLAYVLRSIIFVTALAGAMWFFHHNVFPLLVFSHGRIVTTASLAVAFAIYAFLQGVVFWGIFTLGHDCGHGSFSRFKLVNWLCGLLLHTFISVPYDTWRMSHRHHHKHTGDLDNDEIFYPMRANEDCWLTRKMCYTLAGAWFCYLSVGFPPRMVSHVSVTEPLWGSERHTAVVSVSLLAIWGIFQAYFAYAAGPLVWIMYYFAPWYVFGSLLVITTFLHHNADDTPWFSGNNWNYVRGNLSSIDRDYGWMNSIIHNIGTHQVHHLFPIIPHYNLKAATVHFRAAFPHLVRDRSDRSIIAEFIHSMRTYTKLGGSCPVEANVFAYNTLNKKKPK